MRHILAICPRLGDDLKPCGDEQELEVDVFYECGWCAQFEMPEGCTQGHVWTPDEVRAVQQDVAERAVEPPDPDDGDVEI